MKIHIKIQGFSLLELTIVLGIVSVIGFATLLSYPEQQVHAQWQESEAKLQVVKKAFLKFAEQQKFMPCPDITGLGQESRSIVKGKIPAVPAIPATPAIPKTGFSPTIPAVPATPAQPAIPNIPVSTCTQSSGTVPYEMLGLESVDVEDSWGNPFVYTVDASTTDADALLNCPTDSACFFNRDPIPSLPPSKVYPGSALPAFDNTTLPVKGQLGINNMQICSDALCSQTLAEGLVAIVLALNENGEQLLGLDDDENENIDADNTFVRAAYSEQPYYDDLMVSISGQELKNSAEFEVSVVSIELPSSDNEVLTGNDLKNMGDNTVGSIGTNVGTDVAQQDQLSQSFDFGVDAANKEVVLTFNTRARGTWDQPKSANSNVTSDQAWVSANGDETVKYTYDYTDGSSDGIELTSYVAPKSGAVAVMDSSGNTSYQFVNEGDTVSTYVDYWDTTESFVVKTDANGQVDVDFTVATTANYENIDFTDIRLQLYNRPGVLPDFPKVEAIYGIDQTLGLQ